ncbi:MAG TPA: TolC family protein [bacterium]|jgi:outer membrane protein TolC|nr:TolC family protein [bacterium]HNT66967.1 TolC family protein [bacterium]
MCIRCWFALSLVFVLSAPLPGALPTPEDVEYLSLTAAVQQALQNNPVLAAAEARHQAAHSRVREVQSNRLPQINAAAGVTRYEKPNMILPIHQVGVFPPLDDQIYHSSIEARLPLYSGGRIGAAVAAEKATAAELDAYLQAERTQLIEQIGLIYVQAAELRDRQLLLDGAMSVLEQRRREMGILQSEGRLSEADLALVHAAIAEQRADSLQAAAAIGQVRARLAYFLGSDHAVAPLIEDSLHVPPVETLLPADSAGAVQDGASVKQAQARLDRTLAGRALANRSFLPELGAFAAYQYRSGDDRWDPQGEWAIGVNLNIPLFTGGKRLAARQAAQSEADGAQQTLLAMRRLQDTEMHLALQQMRDSHAVQLILGRAVESVKQVVQAQVHLYREGRLPLSELLQQEAELLELELRHQVQVYNEIRAWMRYRALSGRLDETSLQVVMRYPLSDR